MRIALVTASKLPRPDWDLPVLERAFAERGHEALTVAWDDATADWGSFEATLVRSTWNYVQHFRAFRGWLDHVAATTLLLNPLEAMLWNLHKRYLAELAADGIAVVPTVVVPHGTEPAWAELFDRFGDLVVKPAVSAGSFATVRVARGDAAAAHAHRAAHPERDFLVQPLLQSVLEHGETNMVHLGGRFSHAIHKGARWAGQDEQSRGLTDPAGDELALARHVLGAVAARGHGQLAYARVDVARGADGRPLLMELEIVEPSLYLDRAPGQCPMLVDAVLSLASAASPRPKTRR
jgi:O-ureido-D-serine cyclo-ligase